MTPFLKRVATDLLSRFDDGLNEVAVVFTNKRPIVFLRKHLADLLGKPMWSPPFFTIQEFLAQSSAYPEASPLSQFFVLHKLHNALLREEGRPEETPDEFYPLAETILSDFAQLDYDLVNPEEVYAELRDIALLQQRFPHLSAEQQRFMQQFWESFSTGKQTAIQQKFLHLWARLPKLYLLFTKELAQQKLTTTAGIYRNLAEGRAAHPEFLADYRQIAFIGFNALNQCEAKLFTHWQEQGKALFYFDADGHYLDDDLQEAGLFLRKNLYQYALRNALGDIPNTLKTKANRIDLIAASGKVAQAKLLSKLLAGKSVDQAPPTKTAIILADESLLIPTLQSLPDDIDFNVTMGYPLMQSTLFGFIDLWLTIQQHLATSQGRTVHHFDVEAVIAHPLGGVSPEERHIIQEKINENEWLEVPLTELELKTGSYPAFFAFMQGNENILQGLHLLLEGVLEQRQQRHALRHIEASLILAAKKALNLLQDGLADQRRLSTSFLCSLIRKILKSISSPIEGEPLKGVQIMGLLESRCLDFDEVYIIGANEGTLPKITAPPTFIPDSIRRAHGLPVLENQDALGAYLFYRLLQFPQHITLVYNQVVDDNNNGEVTRFVRQLAFESPFVFHSSIQRQPVKASAIPAPLTIAKTGAVWQKLMQYLDTSDPNRPKLSASGLTTFLQSPLLFFLKYVAEIKEPPKITEEFEMNKLGSVVHQAMQDFYERLRDKNDTINAQDIRQQLKELPQICLQALSKVRYGVPGKISNPNSMQRILLKIAEEYAAVFLHYDAQYVAPFRIVELENEQDYSIEFPITVDGEYKTVRLYGIIDRIDEVSGKTRIVDYKTGRDEVKFTSLETLFAPASDKGNKAMIQTLFYTFVYERVTGKTAVEPNLYIARKLRTEGPIFYKGGRGGFEVQGVDLEEIKQQFTDFLRYTLEELFNPSIPFRHNDNAPRYPNDPYHEFIGQPQPLEDE
ncbi:PD-(D/E)XK nuclease family protein [Parapedobacter tibetensis]|uniref:PD-(D/E)XK nuclease family protein n=1 Tax=Parapedobacter tibetensis TaxID=2972951 RepID=UPI00214DB315|nr:PD-(D/E)XK nuclease family protein [Parapedobacter tibetensis]